MSKFRPAALAVALLAMAWIAAPALVASDAGVTAVASPDVVTGVLSVAGRVLARLPESGALLLWGTGLAAASKVLSRKQDDSK